MDGPLLERLIEEKEGELLEWCAESEEKADQTFRWCGLVKKGGGEKKNLPMNSHSLEFIHRCIYNAWPEKDWFS